METIQINKYDQKDKLGNFYVIDNVDTAASRYTTNTLLVHGVWARYDENGTPITTISKGTSKDTYIASTIQKMAYQGNLAVSISGARWSGNIGGNEGFSELTTNSDAEVYGATSYPTTESTGSMKNYLQFLIDNFPKNITTETKASERNYIFARSDGGYNFNVMINRKMIVSANDDVVVSGKNNGVACIYSNSTSKIENSYNAYSDYKKQVKAGSNPSISSYCHTSLSSANAVNGEAGTYWPVILNVEYEVCSEVVPEGQWTLKYDKNTTDTVKNTPDDVTVPVDKEVIIEEGPNREGYVFKQWCTDPKGEYGCLNPGDMLIEDKPTTITLYAQWGATGVGEQEKTGIVSYIIGFVAVGIIAGTIYLVSKKKNLFKQI